MIGAAWQWEKGGRVANAGQVQSPRSAAGLMPCLAFSPFQALLDATRVEVTSQATSITSALFTRAEAGPEQGPPKC